jgi:DNA polymerase III epsilon subunit family exonuclease
MTRDIPLKDTEFVVFDTETTGLSPLSSLVELGAVKMRGFKIVDTFHTLIRPWNHIPEDVSKVHGISQDMVKNAPQVDEVLGDFEDFLDGSVLVAHNAPFDLKIISVHLQRLERPLWKNLILDTCKVSKTHFPEAVSHSLENLCKFWRSPFEGQHRALEDARHTAFVMSRMAGKMGIDHSTPLPKLMELWGPPLQMRRFSLEHAILNTSPRLAAKVETLKRAIEESRRISFTYLKGGEQRCQLEDVLPKTVFSPGDKIYLEASSNHHKNRPWLCRVDWILNLEHQ